MPPLLEVLDVLRAQSWAVIARIIDVWDLLEAP